ncbi:hypothetical protein EP30_00810 [Bifidobacterium sp. UTCIF-39]|uniref:LacI family DNA-binding transcriptional regulator n=1 Tax=Bifidobacterium sp. UTCIF-39 TaxID=1465359 RepID=UPI001125D3CF|nr:LacI family DNA-binding transcriptional regulator [Bifidobacterium sp. UTCIF-39]TPF97914.1 hypothetical protein EP30_00810 [Bifidobacterium sp. UTCIF-39]
MSEKITIRDVAREAGVSPTTVSRALSRPGRVNLETATKVQEVAERLGYRTKNLEPQQDDVLRGMILTTTSDLKYSVFADFVTGMQKPCIHRNFILLTAITEENRDLERSTIVRMTSQVDGLILTSSRLSDSTVRKAAQMRPTVVVNRLISGVQSVISDDRPALNRIVRRLKALGHQSITYITGPENSWQNGLRWQAMLVACQQEQIKLRRIAGPNLATYVGGPLMDEPFVEFMRNPTTAVVLFNDIFALEFMERLQANGVRVPEQVSVIGIDDTPEASRSNPPLASVHTPREEMGTDASNKLIAKILHTSDGSTTPVVRYSTFIERASVGPAPERPIAAVESTTD